MNSAKNYSDSSNSFLVANNIGNNDSFEKNYANNESTEVEQIEEKEYEQEEVISNNPEDCKDTIFSGEGEILGTAGETMHQPSEPQPAEKPKINTNELVKKLQTENVFLKTQMKKMMKAFLKFQHNHSIILEKENIRLDQED